MFKTISYQKDRPSPIIPAMAIHRATVLQWIGAVMCSLAAERHHAWDSACSS